MIPAVEAQAFLAELDAALPASPQPAALAMRLIAARFTHYRWVGVYWLEGDTLVLGPYVGAPTEHDRIAVGQGVCGTAVAENKNQVIADVRQVANYLACSVETRAEIVVLIRRAGQVIGQIDADGHEVGVFDSSDETLLTAIAERLAAV
jgi:GAF domain-containing protein